MWSFYKHLNVGSSHLWPSRYVCTRRVQFTFRNIQLQEVSFSNNGDVICCFIDRSKEYLLCNFSIFLFNDFTERLVGSLYKCWCLVKLSILILMMCKKSFLPVVKGMHSDAFRFSLSFTIRLKCYGDNTPAFSKISLGWNSVYRPLLKKWP